MKVGVIGKGFVGGALYGDFLDKGVDISAYDKYKKIGRIEDVLSSDIIFLCLPTPFIEGASFDKSSIYEVIDYLNDKKYSGIVVLKSTVEPGFCKDISGKYDFDICHNPEFLTARTANDDFKNQKHIVLGKTKSSDKFDNLILLYSKLYPDAKISICTSCESESMKIFCNTFYASKIMIFNEFFSLCNKMGLDFNKIKNLMLKNDWINPMHTNVPGPDGKLAFGGACFPKDTGALLEFMKRKDVICEVLHSVVSECKKIRKD